MSGIGRATRRSFQLVDKPARSQYKDVREDIWAWSEVKSFFDRTEFRGQGGIQVHKQDPRLRRFT
jgi:hypothetical protein